jgi:hypothetical protein
MPISAGNAKTYQVLILDVLKFLLFFTHSIAYPFSHVMVTCDDILTIEVLLRFYHSIVMNFVQTAKICLG